MLKIEISDPHLMDQKTLVALGTFLLNMGGHDVTKITEDHHTVSFKNPSEPFTLPKYTSLDGHGSPENEEQNIEELDSSGVKWDKRIHARTKTKNSDGTWKLMRGIDPKKVEEVLSPITQPVLPQSPVYPPEIPDKPVVPVSPPQDPMKPQGIEFPDFMLKIGGEVTAGRITHLQVADTIKKVGLDKLPDIAERPDLIPAVMSHLGLMI